MYDNLIGGTDGPTSIFIAEKTGFGTGHIYLTYQNTK